MTDQELKVLEYIREGKPNLVDFADSIGISAPAANYICEKLEQDGYIVRKSYTGINSFVYQLTDKGVNELKPLTNRQMVLVKEGICEEQYKILEYLAKTGERVVPGKVVKEADLNARESISNVSHLVGKGLIKDTGLIRRYIIITDKGRELLKKLAETLPA